jgi:hypothetical protein
VKHVHLGRVGRAGEIIAVSAINSRGFEKATALQTAPFGAEEGGRAIYWGASRGLPAIGLFYDDYTANADLEWD